MKILRLPRQKPPVARRQVQPIPPVLPPVPALSSRILGVILVLGGLGLLGWIVSTVVIGVSCRL